MNQDIKDFLKFFKIPGIVLVVLLITSIVVEALRSGEEFTYYESPNTERVYGDQRVFDYADMLTDVEEKSLEAYIAEHEKGTCTDIVIVTLYEPLEFYELEYRSRYSGVNITPDKWVMVYADKFWEDNKFGYDKPQILDGTPNSGDGVILVDNNYREGPENKIYTWLGTTGKAERELSSSEIDTILDAFYEDVEYNYYHACIDFVDEYCKTIRPDAYKSKIGMKIPVTIALFATFIFILVNWKQKSGTVTTNAKTYLIGKKAEFPVIHDTFLRKSVSKVRLSSDSGGSGGGGGHHSSGGGGSHGGGGHSR